MKLVTINAVVVCTHQLGSVSLKNQQGFVKIDGNVVLIDDDPESCPISMCPNYGITVKPCTNTLEVTVGHSTLVTIRNRPVCLDTLRGFTDGTPPSVVEYQVNLAGQSLVESNR